MKKMIDIKDLKIGMYIVLPVSWFKHPFLKNEFIIDSEKQIKQLIEYDFHEVMIDTAKSLSVSAFENKNKTISAAEALKTPPRTWDPDKLIPVELKEALRDKKLPAEEKSQIVYKSSLVLMDRLFDDPKTENIREAKKSISEIVDLILGDDATSAFLLRITSYDFYTYAHSVNVGVLSVLLAKELFRRSFSHDMHELGAGFFLHDIGKVRVDQAIINKAGLLTKEERDIMRTHPDLGYTLLTETDQLTEECRIVVMQHHERQDGSGYPRRLTGDEIHIYGRICCIADVFDALTSERSYHQKVSTFDALKIMKNELLNHFSESIFERFVLLFTKNADTGKRKGLISVQP